MRRLGVAPFPVAAVMSAALLLLGACGDDSAEGEVTSSSTTGGMGGAAQGGAGGHGGGGGAMGTTCLELWADGTTEPDAQGPDTQIHGTSTFDGDHVWMAWSRPDSGSKFDIWLASYACDGSPITQPVEVTAADDNELDPVLSVSGDRLLVAWVSDNGTGVDNLDIRYRIYALDGTAIGGVIELAASRNGTPVTGNAISPSLAAVDDGWMLAGAWGHPDATGFQAFAVALDREGVVQGDAQDAELDTAFGQTEVAVAVDANGTHLAWQEDSTTSTAPAAYGAILGSAPTLLGEPGARPHVAPGPWFAWDTDGADIVVQPPGASPKPLQRSGLVHDAQIGVAQGQASVLWMEVVSGIRNRIHVAPLDTAGAAGTTTTLNTQAAPSVYPVDLTMIDSTHAVVVYQDGSSPAFRLKADWITLTR